MLERGAAEGQFVLNYYTDESKRKLKGAICLDECEQVIKPTPTLDYKETSLLIGIDYVSGGHRTDGGERPAALRVHVRHQDAAAGLLLRDRERER